MNSFYPALIIVIPLLSAFISSGITWINKRLCYPLALIGTAGTSVSTILLLLKVLHSGTAVHWMAGWEPPWGIELRVDLFNGLVLVVVASVALINLVASQRSVQEEFAEKSGIFYSLYLLFVTGLLGVVVTGDLFNLYVLLEVASLAGYALIAMGSEERAPLASLHYVFLGVIGASLYLLGVGYLYVMTGSLNMVDIASLLNSQPALFSSPTILIGFIFLMVGVWIKMALFPLHIWLPNAYTYAPTSAVRVTAPLMTKAMVYVMIRLMLTVFGTEYIFHFLGLNQAIVWLSCVAMIVGSVLAFAQRDVKRMLTYIIVSEIGYMAGGAWLGTTQGMTGAILHILNDALMTFCLFLAVGNITHKFGRAYFEDFKGIFRKMPWTMAGLIFGGLSIIGVPPTCGFFSKWYLILGAIQGGQYVFLAALIISSLINLVLFFRIFEIGFFEPMEAAHGEHSHGEHAEGEAIQEAPISMIVPLILVGLSLVVVGLYSGLIVQHIIMPFLPQGLT